MSSSNLKSMFFFSLCFALGLSIFYSVAQDSLYQRTPASVNSKVFQISSLSSDEIKTQLMRKMKVTPTIDGMKTIQLSGFSSAICKTYAEIEMEFQGEGMSVGGESTTMLIKAPCLVGQDPADVAAIQLPISQILNQKPKNAEFHFQGYSAKIEFANTTDQWPRQWILRKMQFKNSTGKIKTAAFDRFAAEIQSSDQPIVLEF